MQEVCKKDNITIPSDHFGVILDAESLIAVSRAFYRGAIDTAKDIQKKEEMLDRFEHIFPD